VTEPPPILQMRVETLRHSLEQIQSIETSVKQRRRDILRLHGYLFETPVPGDQGNSPEEEPPDPLEAVVYELKLSLMALQGAADLLETGDQLPERWYDKLLHDIRDAQKAFEQVTARVNEVNTVVRKLHRRWTEIEDIRLRDTFHGTPGQRLGELKHILPLLTALERDLDEAADGDDCDPPGADDLAAAWKQYEDLYMEQLDELFTGYVEVVGGLALRNFGFDHGVCSMADRLIDQCVAVGGSELMQSMAIPAHRRPGPRPSSRVIRLQFPEWTIWAVPLATHEFAHVVLKQNKQLAAELLKRLDTDLTPEELDVILADAFATAVMGPSYACALVLLHLDPRRGAGQPPLDHRREAVVSRTLERIDRDDNDMVAVREALTKAWRTAVSESSNGTTHADEDSTAAAAEQRTIEEISAAMLDFLRNNAESLLYTADRWQRVTTWNLRDNAEAPPSNMSDDTRDVLNAAWWGRMGNPAATQEIADNARALWEERMGPSTTGAGGRIRRLGGK
jgi:hypothetical protein